MTASRVQMSHPALSQPPIRDLYRFGGRGEPALLGPDDPPPFSFIGAAGAAPALLICDHASRAIPADLERLGLDGADLARHIAWDIGVAAVARELAQAEGIELDAERLEVILALRRFYAQFQLSPAMRPLVKYIGQELGPAKGTSLYLLRLFPGSPAKLASKIAGLPKPDNCL